MIFWPGCGHRHESVQLRYGLSELSVVLLKRSLSFSLSSLCTLHAAFNLVLALIQHFLELRKYELPEDQQDDHEWNEGPDDVVQRRKQRVNRLLQWQLLCCQQKVFVIVSSFRFGAGFTVNV